jgi:hypothetical protein
MRKHRTRKSAFEQFGLRPANIRWSWSAKDTARKLVVMALWDDHLAVREGSHFYQRLAVNPLNPPKSNGYRELMRNLAYVRDECDGVVHIIIDIAINYDIDPRKVKHCWAIDKPLKLLSLNEETGAYSATAEGLLFTGDQLRV